MASCRLEVPMNSSSCLIYLLEQLTKLRETCTFTSLLKDMIKDVNQQPDEETHKVRFWAKELLPSGSLGPGLVTWGCILVSQAWKLFEKEKRRKGTKKLFFWRCHCILWLTESLAIDQFNLPNSTSPLPTQRLGDGLKVLPLRHLATSPCPWVCRKVSLT